MIGRARDLIGRAAALAVTVLLGRWVWLRAVELDAIGGARDRADVLYVMGATVLAAAAAWVAFRPGRGWPE